KFTNMAVFKDADNSLKVILFSIVWFFLILIFFSASSAKMVTYILPLFPAFALLTGKIWNDYISENKNEKAIKYSSLFTAIMCLSMAVASTFAFIVLIPTVREFGLNNGSMAIPMLFFTIPVLLLVYISRQQKIKAFFTLVLMMAGIILLATTVIMPVVYNSAQIDLIKYVNISNNYNSGNNELITYGLTKPSLVFYSHKKVPFVSSDNIKLLSDYLKSEKPVFIVTKRKFLDDLSGKVKYNLISSGKRYSLISNVNYLTCYKLKERK
ncbi:MAG: hypothetical protein PHC34_08805, partial [Candidatus Gastranaerophilales bacterium]|nr:hypothetical protein [Candidatus Gastranaerophilales bacterium]